MQRIIMTTAALLLGAGLAVTTAKADMNYGPKETNGHCFQKATNSDEGFFGYWTECPHAAATTAATTPATTPVHRRHPKHANN